MPLVKPDIIEYSGGDEDVLTPCLAEWIENPIMPRFSDIRQYVIVQIINISYEDICNVYTLDIRYISSVTFLVKIISFYINYLVMEDTISRQSLIGI